MKVYSRIPKDLVKTVYEKKNYLLEALYIDTAFLSSALFWALVPNSFVFVGHVQLPDETSDYVIQFQTVSRHVPTLIAHKNRDI